MNFKDIEIIVSEVDGVITPDLNYLDAMNNVLFKSYCMKDFDVVNLLKPYYTFVFLVEDPSISYGIMRARNIPFYFTKTKAEKKLDLLYKILQKYNTTPEHLLYIGSRTSDIDCMRLAEFKVTSADSILLLKNIADYITPANSGQGVISSVYDLLIVNNSALNS